MEGYYSPLRPHVCGASCGKVRILYIISLCHCISLDSISIAVSDQQTKRDAAISASFLSALFHFYWVCQDKLWTVVGKMELIIESLF